MKQLLKKGFAALGYRVEGTRYVPRQLLEPDRLRSLEFDDVICRRMFEHGPQLGFIQVGVFDGVTRDPLRKYIEKCGWRGVMVEPQARATGKLQALYRGNDSIVVMQAALDRQRGQRTLFTINSASAPEWVGGLASFDRSVISKHVALIPDLEGMIEEETVACVTFRDVLERLPGERLDLLQIDAEGADAQILSLFPFETVRPAVVHFEVKHLTMRQREDCLEQLAGFGYRFAPSGTEDMMAIQP